MISIVEVWQKNMLLHGIERMLKRVLRFWNDFWFFSHDTRALGFMRILLVGSLFYLYLIRGLNNMSYYNGQGIVGRSQALGLFPDYFRPPFEWFFWPDAWAGGVHFLYVVLLFLILLGLAVRPMILLAWVLHIGFLHRNYSVNYGADIVSTIFLFYLSFTCCCDSFSVKNLFWKNKKQFFSNDILSSVFYRISQIQIAVIYGYTGLEKLKGVMWWEGTALWNVFNNPQVVMYDFSFLRQFPLVISFITFSTVVYEIYWPVAVLTKYRYLWLSLGVFFHVGIAVTMNIWPFSLVMISTYGLFLNWNDLRLNLKSS